MDTCDKNSNEFKENDLSTPTPLKPTLPRPHLMYTNEEERHTDHAIEEFSPYFFSSNGNMENASNVKRNDNVGSCNLQSGGIWNFTSCMAAPGYTCGEAQRNKAFLPNAGHCCNSYTKESQYGPRISHGQAYDLNLPPEGTTVALCSKTTSQIAPITPEKSIRVACRKVAQKQRLSTNKRVNQESNEKDNGIISTAVDSIIIQSDRELQKLSNNTSDSAVCTVTEVYQSLESEGNHLGSLTRTPEQKPRRKRHRPKVITEGKPRAQKPVTPKQSPCAESPAVRRKRGQEKSLCKTPTTTVEVSSESLTGKTKIVQRKPGYKISSTPDEETAGLTNTDTLQRAKRSCRRSLNFGSEGQIGVDRSKNKFNSGEHSQTQTVALGNGVEVVVENTQTGIAHDLSKVVKQMLQDYSSLPEENTLSAKTWPPWREWKTYAQDSHAKGDIITTPGAKKNSAQIILQTDNQLPPVKPNGPNCTTCTTWTREGQANGTRSKLVQFGQQPGTTSTNLTGVIYNSLPQYQAAPGFPEIVMKKRTGKAQNATSSCVNTAKYIVRLGIMCPRTGEDPSASICNCLNSAPYSSAGGTQGVYVETDAVRYEMQAFGFAQAERSTKKRSRAATRTRDLASLINVTREATHPSYADREAPVDNSAQQTENLTRPHACMEALIAEMRGTLTTKKRTKKAALVNSEFSSKKVEQSQGKIILYNQSRLSVSSLGAPQEVIWNQMHSVDELAEDLQHLDVNRESSHFACTEQNALVPYGGEQQNGLVFYGSDAAIVPFDDSFAKKRRPRPKVDLDEETNRVWKLLIENINNEGIDGTDEDKAKMWEEERNVFRGRANSFIARMHLVQGDRRFSQWKGSVVDSVVGVFLTQNVSDHLSSSAFMSLAARFPLKSQSYTQQPCYEKRTVSETDKPIVWMPDPDKPIKWNEEMSHQSICDQSSMTLHDSELDEGKEVANNNEFSTSSVVSTSREVYSESLENRATTNIEKIIDISDIGENTRATNDAVSSQNSVNSQTADGGQFLENNSETREVIDGFKPDNLNCCNSFMELLLQVESNKHHEVRSNENGTELTEQNSKDDGDNTQNVGNDFRVPKTHDAHTQRSTPEPNAPCNNHSLHISCNSAMVFQRVTSEMRCCNVSDKTGSISMDTEEFASQITTENMKVQASKSPTTNDLSCSKIEEYKHVNIRTRTEELNIAIRKQSQEQNDHLPQQLHLPKTFEGTLDDVESSSAFDNLAKDLQKTTGPNIIGSEFSEIKELDAMNIATRKAKSRRVGNAIRGDVDWDALRKQAQTDGRRGERTPNTMDSLDWEALRCADVNEIANTIKERGMNNVLAARIKNFLNRLVREHGSIDLEWLRHVPPDKAKEYLLSIRGLGLKSVECVRLLTLHHLAFPVDTNVGRIAVRLGWVPLQPLPESLQLHLLELYPVLESIQKYLWPRLCKLDQKTLYELHYQMITFGKVFCTKNKPNCNACPMRGECRHFASAFASARLALPGPEEKGVMNAIENRTNEPNPALVAGQLLLHLPQATEKSEEKQLSKRNQQSEAIYGTGSCEPIVEEPPSPEPECTQVIEIDIEDTFCEDPNEIPTIKLNIEEFTQNLQSYMQNNMELQEGAMSKALVALTAEAASIPMPKLKNVSQLRTEHQVYELPDSHPLLQGLDRREPDDPCSYLLAIWIPGEMADSIQPPESCCNSQQYGKLCDEKTCFTCNSTREADSQIVRGTLLIPCRTATRGSFPLNGTYFQVNEVFADHDSSLNPIDVPRSWIWNLPRRTVYFGTSIPAIFKGLTTEEIQHCFWRGFVCVRGFDQKTRAPRPLVARLHFPASKLNRRRTKDSNE